MGKGTVLLMDWWCSLKLCFTYQPGLNTCGRALASAVSPVPLRRMGQGRSRVHKWCCTVDARTWSPRNKSPRDAVLLCFT